MNWLAQHKLFFLNFYALIKNPLFFTFEGKKIYSNTAAFREHELVKKGNKIKDRYKELFAKSNLRKDVYLIEYPHPMCFSCGYQARLSKNSHAGIFMSEGLSELDPDAFAFLLKHEIAHIKFSDTLMRSAVSLSAVALFAFLITYFLPVWQGILLAFFLIPSANHFLGGLWMRYREGKADLFAMKRSAVDELKGGIRYFSAIKQYNASLSSSYPQYTKDGELARGFHYPTTSSRIENLLNQIRKQTGSTYEPEQKSIDKHVALLKTNDDALKAILAFQPS